MKKIVVLCILLTILLSLAACTSSNGKGAIDSIREGTVAKMELPDGSYIYVDSELTTLHSFADLCLQTSPFEPVDKEQDWLYRIVFNPVEKVKNEDEIIVSSHECYVQINTEYYLPQEGVPFKSILEWAKSKFDYFMH